MTTLIVHWSKAHMDQEATISRVYKKPEKINDEKLVELISEYNANEKNSDQITFYEAEDNSLEVYLLEMAEHAVRYQREAVEDDDLQGQITEIEFADDEGRNVRYDEFVDGMRGVWYDGKYVGFYNPSLNRVL